MCEKVTRLKKWFSPGFHLGLPADTQIPRGYSTGLSQRLGGYVPYDHGAYEHHGPVVQLGIFTVTDKSSILKHLSIK